MDYRKYAYLETYLFTEVRDKFQIQGYLSADDLFCIIIWKSNRSKSKLANNKFKNYSSLEEGAKALTGAIYKVQTEKEKLKVLINWGFKLPMASAILTVLYPTVFTVYDIRVCDVLNNHHKVKNLTFEKLWKGYLKYINEVQNYNYDIPDLPLREKDKYLWGLSFYNDLIKDLENWFKK